MNIKILDILEYLESINIEFDFSGDKYGYVSTYAPLNDLKDNAMIWARDISYITSEQLNKYHGLLLFVNNTIHEHLNCNVIKVFNPHKAYFKVLAYFYKSEDYENPSARIEPSAIVRTSDIGQNVYIGEGTFIDKDVKLGNNVVIQHNVTIQGKVMIGDNTLIQSGASIGSSGFGYYAEGDGTRTCVPHLGGVMIGKNVRIGSLACIQRGCLADTIIEDFARIDNLCNISHNDIIKRGAMVVVGTVVAGSSIIGEDTWIGPGTLVNDGVIIGDRTYCGTGSVVIEDLPEEKVVVGIPARVLRARDMEKDLD